MNKIESILDAAKYLDSVTMPKTAEYLREYASLLQTPDHAATNKVVGCQYRLKIGDGWSGWQHYDGEGYGVPDDQIEFRSVYASPDHAVRVPWQFEFQPITNAEGAAVVRLKLVVGNQSFTINDDQDCRDDAVWLSEQLDHALRQTCPSNAVVTDEMVTRFLSWSVPESVRCDPCMVQQGDGSPRFGTSILTHSEARAMLEHALDAAPAAPTR